MAIITYRASSSPTIPGSTTVKNAPLTNAEVDANFKAIDNDLAEKATIVNLTAVQNTANSDSLAYSIALG